MPRSGASRNELRNARAAGPFFNRFASFGLRAPRHEKRSPGLRGHPKSLMLQRTIKAYAKINLTLDVFERRPDGYHDIASIFQAITLADDITVTLIDDPGVSLTVDGPLAPGVPIGPSNLAFHAAAELLATIEPDCGAHIALTKNIPSQAGLGGGSSDAAATLTALAGMLQVDPYSDIVREIARRLGADVSFFLYGGTARVTGLGETVEPLPDIEPIELVIARPNVGVSTASAYAALDEIDRRIAGDATARWPRGGLANDFEPVVFAKYPEVAAVRDAILNAGCRSANLCGSGSAVFGVCDNAGAVRERLLTAGYDKVWTAQTAPRAQ